MAERRKEKEKEREKRRSDRSKSKRSEKKDGEKERKKDRERGKSREKDEKKKDRKSREGRKAKESNNDGKESNSKEKKRRSREKDDVAKTESESKPTEEMKSTEKSSQMEEPQSQLPSTSYDPNLLAYRNWKKPDLAFDVLNDPKGIEYADTQTMEVFKDRMSEMQFLINTQLISKRQNVLNHMFQIQHKIKEVQNVKMNIIRETHEAVNQIIERLDIQERDKLQIFHRDLHEFQVHLDEIQRFIDRMSHALPFVQASVQNHSQGRDIEQLQQNGIQTNSDIIMKEQRYPQRFEGLLNKDHSAGPAPSLLGASPFLDVHDFIRNYSEYINECHYLVQRPLKAVADVNGNDFHREMNRLLKIERRYAMSPRQLNYTFSNIEIIIMHSYGELLRDKHAKDVLVASLTKERDELRQQRDLEVKQLTELYRNTKEELKHWINHSSSKAEFFYRQKIHTTKR